MSKNENYYTNPIIHSDYSDPDVIRVGDRYIMTASSFNCLPGLPILVSDDLVNWELKNYAIKNLPFKEFDRPAHANGVWAPSIRFHKGKYWIYFGMPDHGIFVVTADDVLEEWSEPICVKEIKGWIDPCPFWDEDEQGYLVSGVAKSRIGYKSKLFLSKLNETGDKVLDDGTLIFDGQEKHPTIEGPKMYKKDGFYYIFSPAGGVTFGWQTVLRSKTIYGPYEDKIVLHQGNTDINGPHQGALVETVNNENWFIHFQDAGVYGRITHLQPVTWENGWPLIGENINKDGVGEPVRKYKIPTTHPSVINNLSQFKQLSKLDNSDNFNNSTLALQWQWFANFKENFYSLSLKKNNLRLFCIANHEGFWNTSNLLLQKFPFPNFTIKTHFTLHPKEKGDISGVIIIGGQYSSLYLEKKDEVYFLNHIISFDEDGIKKENVLESITVNSNNIFIKIKERSSGKCYFYYSICGKEWIKLKNDFQVEKSTWIGAKIGVFSINRLGKISNGYSDFKFFHLK